MAVTRRRLPVLLTPHPAPHARTARLVSKLVGFLLDVLGCTPSTVRHLAIAPRSRVAQ
jgi:hypothetical protein